MNADLKEIQVSQDEVYVIIGCTKIQKTNLALRKH